MLAAEFLAEDVLDAAESLQRWSSADACGRLLADPADIGIMFREFFLNGEKMMDADTRLQEFLQTQGLELPGPPKAIGLYKPALVIGNLCYTSGHLPIKSDGSLFLGSVGKDVDQTHGVLAARQCGLAILASLKTALGSLNRIERVVKLLGMVNCVEGYTQQPAVVNGCSELMARIFGDDQGVGARSAIGVNALPLNVTVEVEGIFLLRET